MRIVSAFGKSLHMASAFFVFHLFFIMPSISNTVAADFSYNLGPGSLDVTNESPGQSARFSAEPMIPKRIVPGGLNMKIGAIWANVWATDSLYSLDYEILHSRLSVSYGVSRRLLLTADVNQRHYFGGALDGFIQGFHDLFGIEQDGRDKVPKNRTRYTFFNADGDIVIDIDDAERFDNANLSAGASYILTPGSQNFPAVNVSAAVSWNVDSPFVDHGMPLDAAIGLGFSKRWMRRWYSYHWVNYTRFGQTELGYFSLSRRGISIANAVVWEKTPTLAFVLQCLYTKGLVENIRGLVEISHESHLGLIWRLKDQQSLEAALIENVFNIDNGPDFGVHVAYSKSVK